MDLSNITTSSGDQCHNSSVVIQNIVIKAGFCILYICIFTLGIFGNALVCYVVFRNKAMQTVTNIFITNLALSDIMLCVLAVPFTPLYSFLGEWIFGRIICHLVPYTQGISIYISTLTLTSIAIDRFFVIIYPLRPRMKLTTCIIIIISIWIISMLLTLPYGIYMNYKESNGCCYCEEDWPNEGDLQLIFGAFTVVMQFILPFFIITYCYVCVSLRLNDRARMKPGTKNARKEEIDRERKKRTNRMLIAMVAIFGISWLPMNVINIVADFYEPTNTWDYVHLFFFMGHCMAMSSTCYNPFLYAWLNENFRKEFKQVLPCFRYFERIDALGGRRFGERTMHYTETVQETLLNSIVNGDSPVRLEPREPTAEPICMKQPSTNIIDRRNGVKEETIYLANVPTYNEQRN